MKSFLEISIVLLVVWGSLYYPYWHLLRPVVFVRLRYRVFEARDRLRMLVIAKEIGEKSAAFPIIEQRCHACLSVMEDVDLLQLVWSKPSVEQKLRAQQDFKTIAESDSAIRDIHSEVLNSMLAGLVLNSPGLLIPAGFVLLCQVCFGKFKDFIMRTQMIAWGATYGHPMEA